jgi:hypothetical protein
VQWVAVIDRSTTAQEKRKAKGKKLRISDGGLRNQEAQSADRNVQSAIPLLLYPEPLKVEVVCISPDGPPQCLWLEGRREPIISCLGPERIETLWWRGPTVRRDYYRITIESGIQLWLFRPVVGKGWFLHGIFA